MTWQDNESLSALGQYIAAELGPIVARHSLDFGELNLEIKASRIIDVARFLRDDPQCRFVNLIDICGVDYPERPDRFCVVYHFMSPRTNTRIRVKFFVDESTIVDSITGIYPGALWFEREAYDMYGILFSGHPDMRRLLTDYGFDGHPLRKDFPLTGYFEVRYDDELQRVVYEPVELRQEFRDFDYESPWNGTQYDFPNVDKGATKGGEQ